MTAAVCEPVVATGGPKALSAAFAGTHAWCNEKMVLSDELSDGMALPDFSPLPPGLDEREAHREFLARIAEGQALTYEASTRRNDDSLFPVRVQLEVLERGDQQVIRGIVWDLSERKEAQARLLSTERLRILGQMASGVAHDLNNILAPILMSVDELRERLPEAGDQETIATLETCCRRGGDLSACSACRGLRRGCGAPRR